MTLGDLIFRLFDICTQWMPRFKVVPSTHAGVCFRLGRPKLIPSGRAFWYCPLIDTFYIHPIARQTLNLPNQVLSIDDGKHRKSVAVSGVVVYEVSDPMKAFAYRYDLDESVSDMGLVCIKEVLLDTKLGDIYVHQSDIDRELKRKLSYRLRSWGVRVINVFLSDLSECRVIRLMGDQSEQDTETEW
jgi:regulator of protease activity HflC (stomatin/prohibitin superfamily)